MKKKIITIIVIIAVIGGVVGLKVMSANKSKYTDVKTSKVVKGDVRAYLSTTGTIKSKNYKEYYGPQQLKVKTVNAKVGDSVEKGKVIITYDFEDLNTAQRQAQIQYNNAILEKQDMLNQKEKATPGVPEISDEKVKQLENSVDLAKINLDAANKKVNEAKNAIVAESNGVVTDINVVEGGFQNAVQPTVVIQDTSSLKAVVLLGKYDASKVKVGQQAEIKDSKGKKLKGKVSFIDPVAKKPEIKEVGDSTIKAEIDILDKPENFKIDFDFDISILLGEAKAVLKVPAESIKTDKAGNTFVYIIEDEKAVEKKVKLGLQSDLDVQILEGLKEGNKVILNPSSSIKQGTLVKDKMEAVKK